jgi:hypothetical protein
VPSLGVSQGQPLHELGEVTIAARPEQEVEMIGHQAVGQQPHAIPGHCFSQDPFECSEIALVLKNGEPGVGPAERVINKSALGSAQLSSHGFSLADRGSGCQQRYLTRFPSLKDGEPGVGPVERVKNKSALGSAQWSSHRIQFGG